MVADRALRQGLEKPEIQGVQKHDLLLTGPLHNRHLSALNAIYNLLGLPGQITLRDRGPRHNGSLHPRV